MSLLFYVSDKKYRDYIESMVIILIFTIIMISVSSCDSSSGYKYGNKSVMLKHENGLVLKPGYNYNNILKTKYGFRFNIGPENSRLINEVEINKYADVTVDLSSFDKKTKGDSEYYYRLEYSTDKFRVSGSGGDEYTYTIWKPDATGGIMLVNYVQQESKPDFERIWQIAQSMD